MAKGTQEAAKTPVQVKVSDILKMLDQGQGRDEIAKHYGLTKADVKRIFNSSAVLRNKRVRPTNGFELIEDVEVEASEPKAAKAAPVEATETSTPVAEAKAPEAAAAPQAQAASEAKGVW